MTSMIKALIVDTFARVPSLAIQRLLGAIVRAVWPGFSRA